jgi:hypothetical protein
MNKKLLILPTLTFLGGCMQLPVESFPGTEPPAHSQVSSPSQAGWGKPAAPAVLYGFDGSPVQGQVSGSITEEPKLGHGVQTEDGSRFYLLELYQQAMDSNDELGLEVGSLNAALERSEAGNTALAAELRDARSSITALTEEVKRADEQKLELAGRLTTAQIRRLEAEKLLLEATIEWGRLQELTGMPSATEKAGFVERPRKDRR